MGVRAEMADLLDPARRESRPKTFVLEVHADGRSDLELLEQLWGEAAVQPTADAYIHKVTVDDIEHWVDSIDSRFWRFHTLAAATPFRQQLRAHVETYRWLDWLWLTNQQLQDVLPGAVIRGIATDFDGTGLSATQSNASRLRVRATGRDAGGLLKQLGELPSYRQSVALSEVQVHVEDGEPLDEAVARDGRFVAANGSFSAHELFVSRVVDRYREMVEAIEGVATSWTALPEGGASLTGTPIGILFSSPIQDLDTFVEAMFNSRAPFRLWGAPVGSADFKTVHAVDLHVGQQLTFQFTRTAVQVLLRSGSCGNTIARFVSNLQHQFDANLTFANPELQRLLVPAAA